MENKTHLSRTTDADINLSKGNRRIRLIPKSNRRYWRQSWLTFSSMCLCYWYLCATASHEIQVWINIVKWKKILCLVCWGILINFFRYGFKIFYPICCSCKRSADASTLYFLKHKGDNLYKLFINLAII